MKDSKGRLPVHYASENGNEPKILRLVIGDSGRFLNALDKEKETPLHLACRFGKMHAARFLMAQMDERKEVVAHTLQANKDGWTPLHHASRAGNADIVRKLLEKGADINDSTYDGRTSFILAALHRREAVLHCMMQLQELDLVRGFTACRSLFLAALWLSGPSPSSGSPKPFLVSLA
ncbi:ankyrin [Ascobolus immersus RN42]|uniref:Ankyrin n=1 Tax=Ascobolus immersus RN42 TaxID=1160509 RepID=A0A3N4IAR3_ASCIM|nr:ankyrin [Ascobolus immersus RN42]